MISDLTRKRIKRFLSVRRSVLSLAIIFIAICLSLTAEFWANSKPIVLKYHDHWYFPVLKKYIPMQLGIEQGYMIDYRSLKLGPKDFALWPLVAWDPFESNSKVAVYPGPPSADNLFGTDDRGRDVLARLIYGFRYSMGFAIAVWLATFVVGTILGGIMGYLGGQVDLIGQRVVEVFDSMPIFLLLITLVSIFGANLTLLVVFSTLFGWIMISQYMRAEFLKLRRRDFIDAARAQGASNWRIIIRHLLPNALGPVLTFSPFTIAAGVYSLAALDYLGFGLPPPTPSWGELLQQAQNDFSIAWWLAVYPSLAMILTLAALNLIGDGIRDAFDPRK